MIGCPFITQNGSSRFDVLFDDENDSGSGMIIHRYHEYIFSISVNTPKYPFTRQLPPAVVFSFPKFAFIYFDNVTLTTNCFRFRKILLTLRSRKKFLQSVIVFGDQLRFLYKNCVPCSPSHQKYINSTRSVRARFEPSKKDPDPSLETSCTPYWGISNLYHQQYCGTFLHACHFHTYIPYHVQVSH